MSEHDLGCLLVKYAAYMAQSLRNQAKVNTSKKSVALCAHDDASRCNNNYAGFCKGNEYCMYKHVLELTDAEYADLVLKSRSKKR